MNLNMAKSEKYDNLKLAYLFIIPLKYQSEQ